MGIFSEIRKFMRDHSFVVVFLIAAVIAVSNYLIYPLFIKGAMDMEDVPVALENIAPGTVITDEMITTKSMPSSVLPAKIIRNSQDIIGRYVAEGYMIPADGLFTTDQVADKYTSVGKIMSGLRDGEWAYTFPVEARYCQDDSLREGQLVDIYFYGTAEKQFDDDENRTYNTGIFGQLAENVRILDVNPMGDNGKYLTVAVNEDEISYFSHGEALGEIFPLVYYGSLDEKEYAPESEVYSMENLRGWIDSVSLTENADVTEPLEPAE